MSNKFFLILFISIISVLSQVNMKLIANQYTSLSNIIEMRPITSILPVAFRIFIPAFLSLTLTLYCYTQMDFSQFVLGSAFYYVLTPLAYFIIFDERLTLKMIIANILILIGVVLAVSPNN